VLFVASAGHSRCRRVVDWGHSVGADAGALFVELEAVSSLRFVDASLFLCREGMCDEPLLSICRGPRVRLHQTWWLERLRRAPLLKTENGMSGEPSEAHSHMQRA